MASFPNNFYAPDRALASAYQVKAARTRSRKDHSSKAPLPFPARLEVSLDDTAYDLQNFDLQASSTRETVLYLAYGSNLSNETFRGNRGIKPISQINVQIPSLRLTFDLPGIPYAEPCFANTARRDPENDPPKGESLESNEKTPLLRNQIESKDYYKNRWHKGLIGVVYEVTQEDYAHIIATEGGGSSYHDILVDCHPFISSEPSVPVPQMPTLPAFKAHTLFAPATSSSEEPPKDGGRFQRPDTSYAQASARYLKLLTDGAAELELPYEYQDYLLSIRPYTITTNKQLMGQFIFLGIWQPFIVLLFAMVRIFADENGVLPGWLKQLSGALFIAVWGSYDSVFMPMFGDGERSLPDGGKDAPEEDTADASGATDLEKGFH